MKLSLHDAPANAPARARAATHEFILSPAQQAALVRFPRRRRKAVRALALSHPYLAQLLLSFPAALYAMACRRPQLAVDARSQVIAGGSLKEVAAALGLPSWTRRVPPEGCCAALLLPLPDGPLISARIGNLMPSDAADWPGWLDGVSVGARIAGDDFALWVARELKRVRRPGSVDGIATIAMWAWYGAERRNAASTLIPAPWRAGLSLANAASGARAWLEGIEFLMVEPPGPIGLSPPAGDTVDGFTFVPIPWGAPLVAEGVRMRNCLSSYAGSYLRGSRVWSVHRDGRTVADLELAFGGTERGVPRLVQLRAVSNTDAPDAIWAAVYRWLTRWQVLDTPHPVKSEVYRRRPGAWHDLWRPLWEAHGFRPGLPYPVIADYCQSAEQMTDALDDLAYLERRGR